MGANAQTSVPTFTAGEVLTAANMNISARTGIPVFADTTARDAAFGGTGEKTLAEGQYAYIENIAGSAATQYYDGAAWQTLVVSGLTLITAQTIGTTVSSVTVTNAFSASYDAYKILITGGASSAQFTMFFKLGSSTTGYYQAQAGVNYSTGTVTGRANSNDSSWTRAGAGNANGLELIMDIINPFLAKYTYFSSANAQNDEGGQTNGFHGVASSFTDFTITPSTGTLTGGTIRVYGYQNS